MLTDSVYVQFAIWGWAVTGLTDNPRQRLRDAAVAALGERREETADGWWDLGLAELWEYRVDDGPAPWRFALAGLWW